MVTYVLCAREAMAQKASEFPNRKCFQFEIYFLMNFQELFTIQKCLLNVPTNISMIYLKTLNILF